MTKSPKTVLISPLNWGLGHATRCIPVIHCLLQLNCKVILCGNGDSLNLLSSEFPELPTEILPQYSIRYPKNPLWFSLKMLLHLPCFFRSISRDIATTKALIKKYRPDLIISDNRYGFRHPSVPSVLITHQTQPVLPASARTLKKFVWKRLEQMMNHFNEVWIPDQQSEHGLSGVLSHNDAHLKKTVFIGPLSRFSINYDSFQKNTILAIASGPEPHRTEFEKIVYALAASTPFHFTLLQGKPNEPNHSKKNNLEIIHHLNTCQLQSLIGKNEIILTRAGYSSIMDMVALRKKAILIPTPGQTEQLYLARHLKNHPLFSVFDPKKNTFSSIFNELSCRKIEQYQLHKENNQSLIAAIQSILKQ